MTGVSSLRPAQTLPHVSTVDHFLCLQSSSFWLSCRNEILMPPQDVLHPKSYPKLAHVDELGRIIIHCWNTLNVDTQLVLGGCVLLVLFVCFYSSPAFMFIFSHRACIHQGSPLSTSSGLIQKLLHIGHDGARQTWFDDPKSLLVKRAAKLFDCKPCQLHRFMVTFQHQCLFNRMVVSINYKCIIL